MSHVEMLQILDSFQKFPQHQSNSADSRQCIQMARSHSQSEPTGRAVDYPANFFSQNEKAHKTGIVSSPLFDEKMNDAQTEAVVWAIATGVSNQKKAGAFIAFRPRKLSMVRSIFVSRTQLTCNLPPSELFCAW